MNNKSIYVSLIVIALLAIGGYFYPSFQGIVGGVSSPGAYTNAPTWSLITVAPLTSTSTSILNSGASDRAIQATYGYCSSVGNSFTGFSGAALAAWTLKISTSTSATVTAATLANTNYIFSQSISTSSPWVNIASTTVGGGLGDVTRNWPVNTYLNFEFNATNTASCVVGVQYLSE